MRRTISGAVLGFSSMLVWNAIVDALVPPISRFVSVPDTRSLVSRAEKPKEAFMDHVPPLRWMAMGDSYTAGPGAGENWDNGYDPINCYRTKKAYPAQLNDDFPFDPESCSPEFKQESFIACSGDTIEKALVRQMPKIPDQANPKMDFIVMTIGGNDAKFANIIKYCILGLWAFNWNCDDQLRESTEIVKSQEFHDNMVKLYDEIFKKLDQDNPNYKYQLYHGLYPQPFNHFPEDRWCDEATMWDDNPNSPLRPSNPPKMTLDLRWKIKDFVANLNWQIDFIARTYSHAKSTHDGQGHAPGWDGNRLWIVDPNPAWEGHRFCEPGVHSFKDPSIYFIPYSGEVEGPEQLRAKSDFKADISTCLNDTERYGKDAVFTYDCDITKAINDNPAAFGDDARIMIPEDFAKIFHPRPNGFKAYRDSFSGAIIYRRPHVHSESDCNGKKTLQFEEMPETGMGFEITEGGLPNPMPEDICIPPDPNPDGGSPDPGRPNDSSPEPTKAMSIVLSDDVPRGKEENHFSWRFYAVKPGGTGVCGWEDEFLISQNHDYWITDFSDKTLDNPPWPGGTYDLTVYGEACTYYCDGNNAGALKCPSFNGELKGCKADPAKSTGPSGIKDCGERGNIPLFERGVVICEW